MCSETWCSLRAVCSCSSMALAGPTGDCAPLGIYTDDAIEAVEDLRESLPSSYHWLIDGKGVGLSLAQ